MRLILDYKQGSAAALQQSPKSNTWSKTKLAQRKRPRGRAGRTVKTDSLQSPPAPLYLGAHAAARSHAGMQHRITGTGTSAGAGDIIASQCLLGRQAACRAVFAEQATGCTQLQQQGALLAGATGLGIVARCNAAQAAAARQAMIAKVIVQRHGKSK